MKIVRNLFNKWILVTLLLSISACGLKRPLESPSLNDAYGCGCGKKKSKETINFTVVK